MQFLRTLAFAAIWLPAALHSQAPPKKALTTPTLATLERRLQERVNAFQAAGSFPGINVGVTFANGKTLAVSAGVADRDSKAPMTPAARMPAGSVGKTYVAAVAMQLAREGRLDLDAKVARYLGQEAWFQKLPNAPSITVRMLMNHTAGLERHEFKDAFQKELTRQPDKNWKPQEMLAYLFGDKPLFPAGQGFGYSDSNYITLGLVLEHVTGQPYYALLRQRILKPLGLKNTTAPESRSIPGLIQGYAGPDNPFGGTDAMVREGRIAFNPKSEWTGGGVVTTAAELSRWAKLLFEAKAFDPSMLPVMLKGVPALELGPGIDYGLGVILRASDLGPTYGHSGFFPGYRTQMLYFPTHQLGVALQVNTSVGQIRLFELAMEVAKTVLQTRERDAQVEKAPSTPTE
jgi:D-alanyl-D-alanine carboxypeptidase